MYVERIEGCVEPANPQVLNRFERVHVISCTKPAQNHPESGDGCGEERPHERRPLPVGNTQMSRKHLQKRPAPSFRSFAKYGKSWG